jgi:hypothetical protein
MSSDETPPENKAPSGDVVLLHSATEDKNGVRVIRAREGRVEVGELRPLEEGKALGSGEIVELSRREESERLYDVKVVHNLASPTTPSSSKDASHKGPARVNSKSYRDRWDSIFGKKEGLLPAGAASSSTTTTKPDKLLN